jgi:hypothetical protein
MTNLRKGPLGADYFTLARAIFAHNLSRLSQSCETAGDMDDKYDK